MGTDFRAWFANLLERWNGTAEVDEIESFVAAGIWRIWKCRNDIQVSRKCMEYGRAVSMSLMMQIKAVLRCYES